jgi:hypothetical protein
VKKTQIRPNGDSRRSCACCSVNCDFVTMGAKDQSILQDWLDRAQGNRFATTSGSSFATCTSKPVPKAGISLSLSNNLDSLSTSSVQSAPRVDGITSVPATTRMSIRSPYNQTLDVGAITDAIFQNPSAAKSNCDPNQRNNGHMKRPRDEAETTETASGRFTKSARVKVTDIANITNLAQHEPGLGLANHILGLSAWLETVSEKEKASEVAMKDVLQRCERQRATITSMQIKEASLEEKFCKLQGQRDTAVRGAVETTAKVRELEAECVQLKSDSQAYKEAMENLRAQLEQEVEKGREVMDVASRSEGERKADQLAIADLASQVGEIPELRRQHKQRSRTPTNPASKEPSYRKTSPPPKPRMCNSPNSSRPSQRNTRQRRSSWMNIAPDSRNRKLYRWSSTQFRPSSPPYRQITNNS